ncbi:signal peptide domain protein [Collimonas pratensis]|uniref:Signal peptide domain protein n=2 Tax=Collimonas pratensis TaxID=279113 RepID=A0A127Q9I6_9BURK|nr:signal peptide domain protein [Collimonas pratensis]
MLLVIKMIIPAFARANRWLYRCFRDAAYAYLLPEGRDHMIARNYLNCRIASALTLTALLAACGSSVPLADTKPEPTLPNLLKLEPTPSAALLTGNFFCELGNRVDLASAAGDGSVKLTWKGRSYPMTTVSTTTGAVRLEDKASGLVWIQIPAKSMLLNSKLGQQLANECKLR